MRVVESKDKLQISVDNQEWTDEDIKILREKYSVYYNHGVIAIRVIQREGVNDLFQIAVEDDGFITFEHNTGIELDAYWTKDLIEVVTDARWSTMFPNVEGQPAEMFVDGKWVQGKIVRGYRFQDGIVTIEDDNGKRYWCGQSRTELYRPLHSE